MAIFNTSKFLMHNLNMTELKRNLEEKLNKLLDITNLYPCLSVFIRG
jgi:hypothetical protein